MYAEICRSNWRDQNARRVWVMTTSRNEHRDWLCTMFKIIWLQFKITVRNLHSDCAHTVYTPIRWQWLPIAWNLTTKFVSREVVHLNSPSSYIFGVRLRFTDRLINFWARKFRNCPDPIELKFIRTINLKIFGAPNSLYKCVVLLIAL